MKLAFVCVFHFIGIGIECLAREHTHATAHPSIRSSIQPTQAIDQLDTLQIFHNLFVLIMVCHFGGYFSSVFFSVVGIAIVTTSTAAAAAALTIDPIANSVQSKRNVYNVCHRLDVTKEVKKCGIFPFFLCYRIPGEQHQDEKRKKCVREGENVLSKQ